MDNSERNAQLAWRKSSPKESFGPPEKPHQSLHYFKLAGNTRTRSG